MVTSASTGTPISTIWKILQKNTKEIAPKGNFHKYAIRKKVNEFFLNGKLPNYENTLEEITKDPLLPALTKSALRKILVQLNFIIVRQRGRNCLREKEQITKWRMDYTQKIRNYRNDGRCVYYLDETVIKINYKDAWKKFFVIHIGCAEGFVDGALHWFEMHENKDEQITREAFREYFEGILPLLADKSVICMDDATYHSVYAGKSQRKMNIVNLAEANGKNIICLPPNHGEFNAIEYAWPHVNEYVEKNSTRITENCIQNLLDKACANITKYEWMNFIQLTIEEENIYSRIDDIADTLIRTPEAWKSPPKDANRC